MEKFTIIEDRGILKKTSPQMIIFGIIGAVIGIGFYIFVAQGAIGGAVLGGLGYGGIMAANTGFKRLKLAKEQPRTVVYADEAGLTVPRDDFSNADLFFQWKDIESACIMANKEANKKLLIIIKNPNDYINALTDKKTKNFAKANMKRFKTPIIVSTVTCKESVGEIAKRINNIIPQ